MAYIAYVQIRVAQADTPAHIQRYGGVSRVVPFFDSTFDTCMRLEAPDKKGLLELIKKVENTKNVEQLGPLGKIVQIDA